VHPRDRLIDATRTVRLFRCPVPYDDALVSRVLAEARADVQAELERVFARRRRTGYGPLYNLLADYPFREGKGLRPATCFAACRAVGGRTEQALLSATALELFHNAFLVHDDVEDGSQFRRGAHGAGGRGGRRGSRRRHGPDRARRDPCRRSGSLRLLPGRRDRLPAAFTGSFDLVYNSLAHHHYPDPPAAAASILRRVLRPGGVYCVVDPGPEWYTKLSAPIARWADPGWIGFHTPDGFRALFRAAGFARTAWIDLLPGFGLAVGQKAAGDLRAAAR
jgi:SAM-dependent methyltransferase